MRRIQRMPWNVARILRKGRPFPWHGRKEGKDIFEEIERESKRYGFEKAWYSDRNNYIAIKENMSFYIERGNRIEISGRIRGLLFLIALPIFHSFHNLWE